MLWGNWALHFSINHKMRTPHEICINIEHKTHRITVKHTTTIYRLSAQKRFGLEHNLCSGFRTRVAQADIVIWRRLEHASEAVAYIRHCS